MMPAKRALAWACSFCVEKSAGFLYIRVSLSFFVDFHRGHGDMDFNINVTWCFIFRSVGRSRACSWLEKTRGCAKCGATCEGEESEL
jgi:hypothetical protein